MRWPWKCFKSLNCRAQLSHKSRIQELCPRIRELFISIKLEFVSVRTVVICERQKFNCSVLNCVIPKMTHSSLNPWLLWAWPHLEIIFFADLSKGSRDELILYLGRALNPMTVVFIRERREEDLKNGDTQRKAMGRLS